MQTTAELYSSCNISLIPRLAGQRSVYFIYTTTDRCTVGILHLYHGWQDCGTYISFTPRLAGVGSAYSTYFTADMCTVGILRPSGSSSLVKREGKPTWTSQFFISTTIVRGPHVTVPGWHSLATFVTEPLCNFLHKPLYDTLHLT